MTNPAIDCNDLNIRVIDQRIGAGIGGMDTVIRVLHVPTGIIVEMPRVSSSQFYDREIALDMIQSALERVAELEAAACSYQAALLKHGIDGSKGPKE